MTNKYLSITATELVRNLSKYLDLVEQGHVIYVIRTRKKASPKTRMIICEMKSPDFRGEIQ